MNEFDVTARNRVARYPKRGSYDHETIYPILDEALICHVSFALDGQPFIIPTIHARQEHRVLLHGLKGGRMLDYIEAGKPVAIAVTIVDGLVCARTAFNHSMNYRSAVIFGTGRVLEEPVEKLEALRCLTERVIPGRWDEVRPPNEKELKATSIVGIEIEQASAKIRRGPPGDDGVDLEFPVWAGVLPLPVVPQAAETDPKQTAGYPVPDYVKHYRRGLR
ncbi:MAG: pyridoxamine 5'-phosphate oxidase family protein [Gammaproteobacteria bacterium]